MKRRQRSEQQQYSQQQQHREPEKLDWKDEVILERGAVRLKITSVILRSGKKRYSIGLYREYNDRKSGFFRPEEMNALADLAVEAEHWIECDIDESGGYA